MKKVLSIILIAVALYQWSTANLGSSDVIAHQVQSNSSNNTENAINSGTDSVINSAYHNRRSDVQVNGSGIVIKLLRDDNKGSRHQKFILRLSSGQTVLIAHNIDLAPRIDSIATGDQVQFYGEYEWNNSGGVVHWTHRDPKGRHIGGWLKHQGKTYQ